jgi:hypothetical protein
MKLRNELHIIKVIPRSKDIPACGGQGVADLSRSREDILKAFNHSSNELPEVEKGQPLCFLSNHLYIGGLRTFCALRDFEFNLITLSQGKSFTLNSSAMNEYILFVFHFNKPKAPLIADPLDSTLHHYNLSLKSHL